MTPMPPPVSSAERRATAWLLGFVRPQAVPLALTLMLSLVMTAFGLAQPWLTQHLIDGGLLGGDAGLLIGLSAAMVGVAIVSALLGAANRWIYTRASARMLFALRESLWGHLQSLPPTFYARRPAGDILSRLDGDVGEIQRFAVDGPLAAVNAVIMLVGACGLMLLLNPWLTVLALAVVPLQAVFLRALRPRLEAATRALRERTAAISGFLVDGLAAMKLTQSVAAEPAEGRRLAGLNQAFLGGLMRQQMLGFAAGAVPGTLLSAGNAVVFVTGGLMVIAGEMSVGGLIAFIAYLGRASGPVQTLLGLYVGWQRARVSLVRVSELLDERPAVQVPAHPRPLPPDAAGRLSLEDVSFAYAEVTVLAGLSLTVEPGAKIGLVGLSGAGKSTLIDLLHRHFDPQAGRILLDGIDLRDLALPELRRRVAVLGQDTVLVPGTVADNLRYGLADADADADADDDALRRALAAAQIDLPLDMPVGERGAALSGGQRQRIALARALLRDPLVLILDEPVSAIDPAAARRLAVAIDALFADRTRIITSHRAEVLTGLDELWELRDGRLQAVAVAAQ